MSRDQFSYPKNRDIWSEEYWLFNMPYVSLEASGAVLANILLNCVECPIGITKCQEIPGVCKCRDL